MPLVRRWTEARATGQQVSISNPLVGRLFGGEPTSSGVSISESSAPHLSAVYCAVRTITDDVATLPFKVFRRLSPRGKQPDPDHHLYPVIYEQANPFMAAFTFWETMAGHVELWGNAYAEIVRNRRSGFVAELWPLLPDRTWADVVNGEKVFYTRLREGDKQLPARNVLHIPGWGFDGISGKSPIQLAKEPLGLAKAMEKFGANFFGRGTTVAGFLTHPGRLGSAARQNLREGFEEMTSGLTNTMRVGVLEEGVSWQQTGIPLEDAQFLEGRNFQVQEAARVFKIPTYKLMEMSRANFSNVEQLSTDYVVSSLAPRLTRIEKNVTLQLLPESDRRSHFARFEVKGLMRGDSAARASYYNTRFQVGSLSQDDIRELEDENPLPDGIGEGYYVPLNMISLEQAQNPPEPPAPPPPPDDEEEPPPEEEDEGPPARAARRWPEQRTLQTVRFRLRDAHRPLILQTATRELNRELIQLRRLLKKLAKGQPRREFLESLGALYDGRAAEIAQRFGPLFSTYAASVGTTILTESQADRLVAQDLETFAGQYAETFGRAWAGSSGRQLTSLTEATADEDLAGTLEQRLTEWEERRPEKVARRETVQAGEAFSYFAFAGSGVMAFRWVATGKNCPFCRQLDGATVTVNTPFAEGGQTLKSGTETEPDMLVREPALHAPIHAGCDCFVVPA